MVRGVAAAVVVLAVVLATALVLPGAQAAPPPGPRALPAIPKAGRVVVVKVAGTIDLGVAPFLERVLGELHKSDLLVLDINTFGGRVDAAVVIRDALLRTDATTVCWVNPRAISAGALISLACDVIAVAQGASIGAATPIQIGQDGEAKPVEEKMVSYMRSEMRATAEAKGRSGAIAEAMVDADAVVEGLDEKSEKGKLLTLDGEQALAWGIAELRAADEPALWKALGVEPARIERPALSWAERLARVLSDPAIAGLLMTLGMLGVLIELYSPGHMIALGAGLTCLGLFFFGHYVVLLAGWEEILLFVIGAGLLAFEVLVPGHIVPGIVGVIVIITSLIMAMVNLDAIPLGVAWREGWITRALASVFGSVLLTAGASLAVMKLLPHTRFGRPLVLETTLAPGASLATAALADLAPGQRGSAATALRPAGKAMLAGRRVDVVLESGYAAVGSTVQVVRVDSGRVTVRLVEESA